MDRPRIFGEGDYVSIPAASAPMFTAGGFVACPAVLMGCLAGQAGWSPGIYQLAYEQARAAMRPTLYERSRTESWN